LLKYQSLILISDEYGSTRSSACNSTNIGKSKGKAPPRVRKMDNHIVDCDVVESDDDLSDDIHGIVLLIILISGLMCMMGIDTPSRFEAPQES
jgi:hypothetical protein